MSVWNLLTDKRKADPASHATLQEHPLLTFVAEIAKILGRDVDRYQHPFTDTQWHPIYRNKRLSTETRRAMREAELPDEWTGEVWREARAFWDGRCAACGRKTKNLHRDHLVPLADQRCPGATVENLIPLCPSCNIDKSANDLAQWHLENFGDRRRTNELLGKIAEWQDYARERFPLKDRHQLRAVATKSQHPPTKHARKRKRRRT